jgi:hypothetical protein
MAIALDSPFAAAPARPMLRTGAFAVPALTSLGAGAIHAAAIGAHNEHRQAVFAFAITAVVQLGLGAAALVSNRRLLGVALAASNLVFIGGWVLAKRTGIERIEGLDRAEALQWADGLAVVFAAFAVIGVAAIALLRWRLPASDALVRVLALPIAALSITGMVAAGGHAHAGADDSHAHDATTTAAADGAVETPAVAPTRPFIPGEPIDLSAPGVTPKQQAEAENILAATLYTLPQFADPDEAARRGWFSIGDAATGDEHFVNPSTFDDGKILDPNAPESLVYEMIDGKKTLVAAMYMLWPGATMADVPDIGGALMQWHIHDNLCFSPETGQVAGLRAPGTPCTGGLVKGGESPMIHVWIQSHPCGPFAALEGIAGGTIAAGETRLCDTAHGH